MNVKKFISRKYPLKEAISITTPSGLPVNIGNLVVKNLLARRRYMIHVIAFDDNGLRIPAHETYLHMEENFKIPESITDDPQVKNIRVIYTVYGWKKASEAYVISEYVCILKQVIGNPDSVLEHMKSPHTYHVNFTN